MSSACNPDIVPGTKLNISTRWLMAEGHRPSGPVPTGCRRWGSVTGAAWIILTSGAVTAQTADPALIEEGRKLFMEETFEGNGRTCATCHPPTNNFTIDPEYIRTLKGNDPLFLTGPSMPELKDVEVRQLLRNNALVLENVDGFDNPGVLRGVPHTLALRGSLKPDVQVDAAGIKEATGWSGDGSPDGTLRGFAIGAVIQHLTKSPERVPGRDFRLPTQHELDALNAFQLSLGRQEEIDIASLNFTDDFVTNGRDLFLNAPSRNGAGRSCNACHRNAGAGDGNGVNRNRATGTNLSPNAPACLSGFKAPFDGGFGIEPVEDVARADICGKGPKGGPEATAAFRGDMSLNVPPLIEAADTPPFFHNNSAATIEDAVAFYTSDTFNNFIAGAGNAFVLDKDEVNQIAAFMRALNVQENIRSSNVYDTRANDPAELAPRKLLVDLAIAETTDAIEDLTKAPVQLFVSTDVLQLLQDAQNLERQAAKQDPPDAELLDQAIALKETARDAMVSQ